MNDKTIVLNEAEAEMLACVINVESSSDLYPNDRAFECSELLGWSVDQIQRTLKKVYEQL